MTGATSDPEAGRWTVIVDRDGKSVELTPPHLVFAAGMSGEPTVPDLPGRGVHRGDQHHSSRHPGPEAYRGKKVVVIGSNNSALDICGAPVAALLALSGPAARGPVRGLDTPVRRLQEPHHRS